MGQIDRLIEVDQIPVFYADGIASVLVVGVNIRVTFFEYRIFCGERVRYQVQEMIRPSASYESGLLIRMIEASRAATLEAGSVMH